MGWLDEMKNEMEKKRIKQFCSSDSHKNLRRCIDFFLEQFHRERKKMKEQQEELWKMQYNVHVYKILRYPPTREEKNDLFFSSYQCMD